MLSAWKHGCLSQLHSAPHLSRGETPQTTRQTPSVQPHRAIKMPGEVWYHIFRPAPAPGLSWLQGSLCASVVQLRAAQPNDVIWPGAFLLGEEEYLGRKELVLDICGKLERKMKSSPISETITGAGNKHCTSAMCPSAKQLGHWPLRSHVTLAGHTN